MQVHRKISGMGLFWWRWSVVIAVCGVCCCQAQQNLTCNSNDLEALRGFMKGLVTRIDGWDGTSSDCCNWVGITCTSSSLLGLNDTDNGSGRVTSLVLVSKRLTGVLSESLGNLVYLKHLNLSHNYIKHSLPRSLFNLSFLEDLDLSSNELDGPVPVSIDLPSLRHIDISSNSFNGSLPTWLCQNSQRIHVIGLADNHFSGVVSPGLGSCSLLEVLYLGMNALSGSIPEDIFQLQNLKLLALQDNKFSGQLSSGIGNLSSLIHLDVSKNGFSGTIPDVFGKLKHFRDLVALSNQFEGDIPASLSNSPTVELINLRNNSLGGKLEELNCSALTKLASLDLATNRFGGSLPSNLPSCRNLKSINLARNNFSGQIPESYTNFHSLSFLSLANSSIVNISSAIQILGECRNLTTLVINLFYGEELPTDPSLHFENLKVLVIADCRLRGSIPQWLKGCTKLQLLDLSFNQLSGTIPGWFGQFPELFYLDLSNNKFTGEIPKSITALPSLIDRNISLDEPSLDFPFFMKRNESARGLQYNQIWSFPPTVDLSHNLLTGKIWPEFRNLKNLHVLELKFNNISGTIPSELSEMSSLEVLDLAHNSLTGTIPSSLVNLTFLSRFSVAYNNLSGRIPSGGQFATFPNSSFEGNQLCGEFQAPCDNEEHHQIPSRRPAKPLIDIGTIIGIGVGFISSFSIVVYLRLCSSTSSKRRRRH